MKFRQALFISFHGDMSGTNSETKKSYFYQKDKNLDREYTIKMHSDHKRKALLNHEIPFIRINFPYFSSILNKELNIERDKNNCEIAEGLMAKKLRMLEPFSRIYISAQGIGGTIGETFIKQYIKVPKQDKLELCCIPASNIAEILYKYISNSSRNNLQIFLMISQIDNDSGIKVEPKDFASSLMERLHQYNFKKTSVIAYDNACSAIELTKNSKNVFNINDVSTRGRQYAFKRSADELHFKHGKKQPDNKIAIHNYNGQIENTEYRSFKKAYMNNFNDDYKSDLKYYRDSIKNDLIGSKFEVLSLKNALLSYSLSDYLDNYEQKSFHGIKHHHGKTGFNRIMCFHRRIAAIIKDEDISDAKDLDMLNRIANRIIVEIINFAKQDGEYRKFAGNFLFSKKINVHDNSGMTKILEGLQTFYKQMEDDNLANKSLQKFREVDIEYTNLSNKKERESLLVNLKSIDPFMYETSLLGTTFANPPLTYYTP
ncbi:hypothetical protein IB642_03645 [Allofrancisella guangzhouensis]|uniref:Uncharacterized protein n=1 Tax=Allofrancisella guangzhouensis TaxID=594679 RepID=A0A0A8E650_9GAMM|nr:hypothetical protein [Allofrancisella guangzhouensis]AJC49057.1 hypothetical protein SD28_05125 [Allofrancisella guangzhouensis]MBK2027453.1 hypothetical protein [Allofrancisella guangzhouensis]MBK2044112.1 hypothetical protein [Allofrancisella guangzhouensis]MBK2045459.1 hypothetical protein [Allofrancisella guangzhouensis]